MRPRPPGPLRSRAETSDPSSCRRIDRARRARNGTTPGGQHRPASPQRRTRQDAPAPAVSTAIGTTVRALFGGSAIGPAVSALRIRTTVQRALPLRRRRHHRRRSLRRRQAPRCRRRRRCPSVPSVVEFAGVVCMSSSLNVISPPFVRACHSDMLRRSCPRNARPNPTIGSGLSRPRAGTEADRPRRTGRTPSAAVRSGR